MSLSKIALHEAQTSLSLFGLLERRLVNWKTSRNHRRVIVLDDLHAGYIPIAKAGSSSIRMLICARQARLNFPAYLELEARPMQRRVEAHIRRSLNVDAALRLSKKCYLFSFVRNPITRLYSCYMDKVVKAARLGRSCTLRLYGVSTSMPLEAFVECIASIPDAESNQHFRSQHLYLRGKGQWLTNFVGRFEHFDSDWKILCHRIGLEQDTLPVWRQTGVGNALSAIPMSRNIAEIAVARYREDIEYFGYQDEIANWLNSLR